nr:CMF_HP1_G0046360.mRNA.1.CDS.1 [Saccharomyces cerevisiae]
MLCCLLSLDMTGNENLSNITWQGCNSKKYNPIGTFQNIVDLLRGLHFLLSTILVSLNDHKQILYAFPEETSTNTGCEKSKYMFISKE